MKNNSISSYYSHIKSFSQPIKRLFITHAIFGIGFGIYEVLLNIYLSEIGYPEGTIGRILAVKAACGALFSLFAGWLADKQSRKFVYITGLLMTAIGYTTQIFSNTPRLIFLGAAIGGIGHGSWNVAIVPYIQENASKKNLPYALGLSSSLMWFTAMISAIIAGRMPAVLKAATFINTPNKAATLRFSLLLGILIIIAALLPASGMAGKTSPQKTSPALTLTAKDANEEEASLRNPFFDMAKFALCNSLMGLGAGLIIPYFNLYFKNWVGVSLPTIGTIFALGQIGTAIGSLSAPLLSQRFGPLKSLLASSLLSLPLMVTMAFTKNLYICSFAYIFRGALINTTSPLVQEILMNTVPQNLRARASATNNFFWNLTWAISMSFSGTLIRNKGYAPSLLIASFCYLLAAFFYWYFFRNYNSAKRTAD